MSVPTVIALTWLGYATAAVTLTAAGVWLLLRLTRLQSPAIHRLAWFAVLLQGIMFWRVSVELPVLPMSDLAMEAAPPVDVHDAPWPHNTLANKADTPLLIKPTDHVELLSSWPSFVLGSVGRAA